MDSNSTGGFILQTMLYLVNHNASNLNATDAVYNDRFELPFDANETRCYGAYGCFDVMGPWMIDNRPQAHPFSPAILDVKFPTFTSKHRKAPVFIDINDPETVQRVGFNRNGQIYVISHGFLESGTRPWVNKMMNALLDYDETSTVIVVDWKGGSSPPYYQAVANIRLIGNIVAHVIACVYEELGLKNLEKVHLIGHSLGAHLSGYAGYNLQRDFGLVAERITALDPAEPFFANTETIVRLDQSDAKYVDVIHSDISNFVSGGFGLKQKIGHVDFYPNGGREQPGCDENSLQISCNHVRSIELFIESIHTKCPFMSIMCESYEAFVKGECSNCNRDGHFCIKFGFHSRPGFRRAMDRGYLQLIQSPIATYLLTTDKEPFCAAHFKVTVVISNSEESRQHGGEVGVLFFTFTGNRKQDSNKIQFNQTPIYFKPASNHTFLTIGDEMKEDFDMLKVEYRFKQTINPLTWRIFTPRIYVESIVVESMEHNTLIRVCPSNQLPVAENEAVLFKESSCLN